MDNLQFSRYSSAAFPEYRFIPGQTPHPTESFQGHSYGLKPPVVERFSPPLWRENKIYLYAVDLYNHGYWWEAHEELESLWRVSKSDRVVKDYLQGLIKISGAMLKGYQQKYVGMETLYTGGIEHLKETCAASENFMGLDLMTHIAKLFEHYSRMIFIKDPKEIYINYPYIVLDQG